MKKTRIFLLDDHTLLRNTLRLFLESKGGNIEVVGEGSTAAAAVEDILRLRPDMVLMELALSDADGVALTAQILTLQPQIKIVAVTMYDEQIYLLPFLQAGGIGYVHKTATDRDLLVAIEQVCQNEVFLSEAGLKLVASEYRSMYLLAAQEKTTLDKNLAEPECVESDISPDVLSERELQILRLMAHGYNFREIGKKLYLAISTIETYRSRLGEKLQLQKKSELIGYAIRHKLL